MEYTTDFIDQLLAQVNLIDLMRRHGLQVKDGSGNNAYYIASWCCGKSDFDNGRIKKSQQTYKCNACMAKDQGGKNAIHFLREYAGMTFHEAIQELCKEAKMEPPNADPAMKEAKKRKELALRLAADFYHSQNNNVYLLSRGIAENVLAKAKAGYAPGGRALRTYLEQHGFTKDELKELNLINHKGMDSFFYRAVIPVYRFGKVIDLYGRAVDDSKAAVKHFYLYGDEILGGYDELQPDRLIIKIYESAIDRLAAESHGIDNGVDPGGAMKFTAHHARLLRKKGDKAFVIYDGDKAGREGALLTGQLLVNEGFKVWIAELAPGQDPASILQNQSKEAFFSEIQSSKPFEQFKMYQVLSQYPLAEIEQYLSTMKEAVAAADPVLKNDGTDDRTLLAVM